MRPIRSVSVLVPTWQGIGFLERSLEALARQKTALAWDFLAIDSGSTDGTWELLGRFAESFPVPFRRQRIDPLEFDHGDTRNLLASRSRGDLLVYLTQDAIPTSEGWLAKLAANFNDPRVGAASCRNVPRSDADLLTKLFSANDPGYAEGRRVARIESPESYARMTPEQKRLLYNFNDVASAIRRELWELHPFPRTSFGEDILMARAFLEAGHDVVYDDEATVEHSHDYEPDEMRRRARIDGKFNAEWLGRICVASRSDAHTLAKRQVATDEARLLEAGRDEAAVRIELRRAVDLRRAAFEGLHEGGLTERRRPATRFLERRHLSILYVVHGFPPDTWAGTEVYTLGLAREMQRRGHRVTILARAPASKSELDGGPAEFALTEDVFEGLRVLRLTHRLQHASVASTYDQPDVDRALREILGRERPDLVHFMHLIHLSAGLVGIAREHGIPTVITCHDYWAICARVQLIRPDGERCEENMGSGCFPCIRERGYGSIGALHRMDALLGPLVDRVAEAATESSFAPVSARRTLARFADLKRRRAFVEGAYQAADLRISPSRFLRQKLVDTAGFEPESFLYSDNGLRTDHLRSFERGPDAEGHLRFGFVGSLVWYKGSEVMLRAMKRLEGTKAVLHVHGDFRPEEDPHHAALAAGAGPNVRFHGRFDNARLAEVLSGIDVLLVPSLWWENSPITIHEAFLTKTPLVVSGIGGMKELVRDGIDGLQFRPGDDEDLAAKMRRLLDEPELLAQLASEPPAVKTIEEDAAATEYRYRALCCLVRDLPEPPAVRTLYERMGRQYDSREGPVEEQGADMLLLRPGGAAAEYDIRRLLRGSGRLERTIVIEQCAFGSEPRLDLGGRILVDDVEVGILESFRAPDRDQVRVQRFTVDLPPTARRLRLESSPKGSPEPRTVRVRRVAVIEDAVEGSEASSPGPAPRVEEKA